MFFNLCALLESKGHVVIPFSCNYPQTIASPYQKYFIPPIVTEGVRYGREGLRTAQRFLWSPEAAHALDRLLTDHPVDVAHLHNIYHQISPSILPILARHRVPVVMTLHDFHLVSPAYGLLDAQGRDASYLKGHRWRAVASKSVKNSYAASALCALELSLHRRLRVYERGVTIFIAPSNFLLRTIQEWGFKPAHFAHLPNFIDTTMAGVLTPPSRTVLYVGRLSEEKGIRLLVQIAVRMPKVNFEITGSGPLDEVVRGAVSAHPNIIWHGHVPPERIHDVYQRAGVVILPTIGVEVMPLAILEAFAAGRPVIASRVGGIPELVEEGITGALVERGDIDGFCAGIQNMLADPQGLARMGHTAYERVRQHYSAQEHYHRLLSIYQEALSSHISP